MVNTDKVDKALCKILGHKWHYWEGGHVYADDTTWSGSRYADGTPYVGGFRSCDRCGATG